MYPIDNNLYWLGRDPPKAVHFKNVKQVHCVDDLPDIWGGILCVNLDDPEEQSHMLVSIFSHQKVWSWAMYVTHTNHYSDCLCDGVFNEQTAYNYWLEINHRLNKLSNIEQIDPLTGWLGIQRTRRVTPFKQLNYLGIYQYPIIEALYPELYSTYRYVLSEVNREMLEPEKLVDRIRVCKQCNSGHLNYVEVCPNCKSIDIDVQTSLHCFTCGHVGDQQSFLRKGKLECPNCLTQLRHIGVDYDRPLETHICRSCFHLFVEPETISNCLNCETQTETAELIVQKIHQLKLGQLGEYVYQHGKVLQAPELSIKGKVDAGYFENILLWLNKVALRHDEEHLLLSMYLPRLEEYSSLYGDSKMFALLDQITVRLNGLFRDTDICCQYKQDVLLVLMPKTKMTSISVLQKKIEQLSSLIEEEQFVLHVSAVKIPDPTINEGVKVWLAETIGNIYAAR
ncbi:diguanylate cyclase [Photobacterium sp. ZSDE20]|uniref:Diguanylate cyclase n=1 Tax=Photobacterium pectinilyticum TaxID=2906793 RepID=A0ABT1N4N8_9GAMM|nr:diguanylate cyclase [Photobacterium sp. ZSDE20]MCQ1058691.1 diguanylate cyclase [Photobacterium sp. ZSDE20]MDD1823405.1 diguanylate cyclase [Photobacterium sp. ZSDE20]